MLCLLKSLISLLVNKSDETKVARLDMDRALYAEKHGGRATAPIGESLQI